MTIARYAFLMRPPMPGAMPREGLLDVREVSGHAPSGRYSWGWAEYSRKLTPDEIQHYDLEYVASYQTDWRKPARKT